MFYPIEFSFMLRDGVCDEATNTEECFFDGGDCCTENTAVWNCECMLDGMASRHTFITYV